MSSKFIFDEYPDLNGKHALFSPSQSSWLRYDEEKVAEKIFNQYRTALGTEIHEFAADEIEIGHKYTSLKELSRSVESYIYSKYKRLSDDGKLSKYAKKLLMNLNNIPKEVFEALKCYINDGVGFRMNTEVCLYYSDNCFGHSDTVSFNNNMLRIHDLKTGDIPAHMEQLEIYAALFCMHYKVKPSTINIELRIYQWDGISVMNPTAEDISAIIDKILSNEKIASEIEKEI